MPRKSRIDASGALHHVVVRGINRQQIFLNDADQSRTFSGQPVLLIGAIKPLCDRRNEAGESGMSQNDLAQRLQLTQPAVSQAIPMGRRLELEMKCSTESK
jgi:hypothetical protein